MANIMIVDDEVVVLTQLEECMELLGHKIVGEATSGEEAVTVAHNSNPDLILMDIKMPGKFDGIDAAEKIKAEKDIPLIFLTAYSEKEFIERAKKVGPFGYLIKPFQREEIKATVEIALYKSEMDKRLLQDRTTFRELPRKSLVGITLDRLSGSLPLVYHRSDLAEDEGLKNEGLIKNFSDNGLYFVCKQHPQHKLAPNQLLNLSIKMLFQDPDLDNMTHIGTFEASGRILRIEERADHPNILGVAIKFLDGLWFGDTRIRLT
jgi:CheY-like chemotaxis protein